MIGYLKGTVKYLDPAYVLLEVNGVGYEVVCSGAAFSRLSGVRKGEEGEVYTYLKVSEDDVTLFGFVDPQGVCSKVVNVYVDKCTETNATYGEWDACSRTCGGGIRTRTITYYSTFGSNFACSTSQDLEACNTLSCNPSSGGDSGSSSGSGDCSYGPDGTSNCWGMCGTPGATAGHCCTHSGPCH